MTVHFVELNFSKCDRLMHDRCAVKYQIETDRLSRTATNKQSVIVRLCKKNKWTLDLLDHPVVSSVIMPINLWIC